jgi:hypothetical protein
MTEKESPETKISPESELAMHEGIEMAIDNYELFDKLVYFIPASISFGEDERIWEELNEAEKGVILDKVFSLLDTDPNTQEAVKEYSVEAPATKDPAKTISWKGKGKVKVYETKRSDEDIFLHEFAAPELETLYFIAPKDFKL